MRTFFCNHCGERFDEHQAICTELYGDEGTYCKECVEESIERELDDIANNRDLTDNEKKALSMELKKRLEDL